MIHDHSKKLAALYQKRSKHSSYQNLAESLRAILPDAGIIARGRHEQSRFKAILSQVPLDGARLLDIGGNTGYFTFTAIENGAESVDFYEGNASHAEFVRTAAFVLGLTDRIKVYNSYFEFSGDECARRYDVCFCLNVIHHLGDDFKSSVGSIRRARENMIECINNLSHRTNVMVFQMGFNWKGDVRFPLFPDGTKREMIAYISAGTRNSWEIRSVYIPQQHMGEICYEPANEGNLVRRDRLGEFLNRPLFFLKSRSCVFA